MNPLCLFGVHKPRPSKLWNDGHFFSACARCAAQLVRTPEEPWHVVPPNMKVVWRPRTEEDVVWPSHIL